MASCNICDDEITKKNPLFICLRCDLKVHKLCYGAEGLAINWKCSPCRLAMKKSAKCKLCHKKGGAMKQTECKNWVHVICGLFMKGVSFSNEKTMEPVNLSKIPSYLRGKLCSFCNNKTGYCTSCSFAKCKNKFHVTCAQDEKTLKEDVNPNDNSIKFEAFCMEHKPTTPTHRLSSGSIQVVLNKNRQTTTNTKYSCSDGDWILIGANAHSTPANPNKRKPVDEPQQIPSKIAKDNQPENNHDDTKIEISMTDQALDDVQQQLKQNSVIHKKETNVHTCFKDAIIEKLTTENDQLRKLNVYLQQKMMEKDQEKKTISHCSENINKAEVEPTKQAATKKMEPILDG
ncbi:PHD finger protein rhinoceros-like, partial [Contarinia nasturtii]|uniref:PHD finger protein rhinoceros-like n=1 Tax=Contarinia nasturtii TaxID=265458 RepID=UPI0012D44B43